MLRKILPRVALLIAVLLPQHLLADWDYRTVEGAGGVPLNVVTEGDPASPPILLIHGFGQSHYSFVHQLNSDLAEDYFLVTFDLRGHGGSGKPWAAEDYTEHTVWAEDVAAVVSATGIERPVVVAWSYGTMIAMDYIREHGTGDIAGIILTGGQGGLKPLRMPGTDDPDMAELGEIRVLQQSRALADNIRAGERVIDLLTASPLPEPERELFRSVGLMVPAYVRRAMVHRSLDNQDLVDRLSLPVLFALGAEDNPFQLEDAAELAASRENVSLTVYEGAGHSVFLEQPQRFNDQLRRFAEETRSDASRE